jgi:phage shock protein C
VNPRRLYRCRHDRLLAGVASGMAEYLEIDPTVVRILWILSAFLGGFTILLYIILVFVIPLEPSGEPGAPGGGPQSAVAADGAIPGWTAPSDAPLSETLPPWASSSAAPSPGTSAPDAMSAAGTASAAAGTAATAPGAPGGPAPATWPAPPHRHPAGVHDGRAGLFLGVLLVVFGAIALANALLPGWAAAGVLGPAFLVALGVALMVVAATNRRAFQR